MIRNVVMGRLRATDDAAQRSDDLAALRDALAGIAALDLPGCAGTRCGLDAGLRDGGWDFAITSDWETAQDYRVYDRDPGHNVHRSAIVSVCEQVARVQFEF